MRRIPLPLSTSSTESEQGAKGQYIISSVLSKESPNQLWVGTSDGRIFCIDWTNGSGVDSPYQLSAGRIFDMTVDTIQVGKATEDVLLVLEKSSHSVGQVVAYNRDSLSAGQGKSLYTCSDYPRLIRSANSASVIVVTAKDSIHVGSQTSKSKAVGSPADLAYRFFSFGIGDLVTSIDVRCSAQAKKQQSGSLLVDLAVGCARGAIFLYQDVLARSPFATSTPRKGASIQPRKQHWHRRAVHSVKWSHDGKSHSASRKMPQLLTRKKATT